MLTSIRNVKFYIKKMRWNTMFITAVCVIFLIKLRWPKNKSLYDPLNLLFQIFSKILSVEFFFVLFSSNNGIFLRTLQKNNVN